MRSTAAIAGMTPQDARETLWHLGDLSWKLRPQQREIYRTIKSAPWASTVVVLCHRQFGKSVLGSVLASEDCLLNPEIVVVIIAPKVEQAAAIVRPRMKRIMKDMPAGLIREVKSENTWYFANGSELKLGGYGTGAVSQRGKTLYKVYLEEFGPDADPDRYLDFIHSDILPTMTESTAPQIFYLTTLPKIPDHPFVTHTIPEAKLNGAFFKYTLDDNTHISQERKDKIAKDCGGRHTTAFRREYLCEIVRDESIVLVPEFVESEFVKDFEIPKFSHWWVGGDTGGTRDKTVLTLFAYDFDRRKILVVDESAHPAETATSVYVAGAKKMEDDRVPKPRKVRARYVDGPGRLRLDLAADHAYPVMEPQKDELDATVHFVRLLFIKQQIEVHPRCKLTIETLRSGHFNEKRTDLNRTTALGHMDAFMALAYGARHADTSNPYPPLHGLHPERHHIPEHVARESRAHALAKALTPKRRR